TSSSGRGSTRPAATMSTCCGGRPDVWDRRRRAFRSARPRSGRRSDECDVDAPRARRLRPGRPRRRCGSRHAPAQHPRPRGRLPDGYAVASELKALLAVPQLSRELDLVAVEQYLAFDYVIGPRTILRDVRKLPAGDCGVITTTSFKHRPYWTLSFHEIPRVER